MSASRHLSNSLYQLTSSCTGVNVYGGGGGNCSTVTTHYLKNVIIPQRWKNTVAIVNSVSSTSRKEQQRKHSNNFNCRRISSNSNNLTDSILYSKNGTSSSRTSNGLGSCAGEAGNFVSSKFLSTTSRSMNTLSANKTANICNGNISNSENNSGLLSGVEMSGTSSKQQQCNLSTGKCGHVPCVQLENINPCIVTMEYAVRGPLVIRAGEIENELKAGKKKPFDEVIRANIGDCHAMGQKPITFLRQVLALTIQPSLFNSPDYAEDAKQRAREILHGCRGESLGSYSDSAGIEVIRQQAANYIKERDGFDSNWQNIILTAGASQGIKGLLSLLRCEIDGKTPGVMVPIPQYPLYSATIAEFGMHQIGYYLDESKYWGLNISELERALNEARKVSAPRALCIINPGNPTGQVLTRDNIEEIVKFAYKEKLFLFADEVYQDNVYDKDSKFHSFKKVLMEMGEPYNQMELASFMSCSKGYMGECGIRGGYMEMINVCPQVKAMFLKSLSAQLCPTTVGQAAMSCVVNPPKPGEPSYEQFIKEKNGVLSSLKERAELVYKTFNSFEGFSCNPVQGAMYAFPQFKIPPKAIEAAKKAGKAADVFYAFELLENTGICIVPGSGFGQQPGTYHFRTTILPQTDLLKVMLKKFQKFHQEFMAKYK